MKAYTNVEQSKKLAEILPIESADMSWAGTGLGKPFTRTIPCKGYPEEICPCWSLAALLEVMPKQLGRYTLTLFWWDDSWYCSYIDDGSEIKEFSSANNPVDATVEMIVKLKKQDLL